MYSLQINEKAKLRKILLDASDLIFSIKAEREAQSGKYQVASKGFGDYVSEVDLAIQKYIEEKILEIFPNHQFFGEEGEAEEYDRSQPCWILDPIDGTTNLIRGLKHSCISLGFWNGARLSFGLIYNPFLDELFEASFGEQAYLIENAKKQILNSDLAFANLQKSRIVCSPNAELEKAITIFGTCPHDRGKIDHTKIFQTMGKAFLATEDILRTGSAALDLAAIASGRADIFFEYKLRPWDFAAGIVICQEAGAVVTDLYGKPVNVFEINSIFCANPILHQKFYPILEALRS